MLDAWAAMTMEWVPPCRNLMWMSSLVVLVARKPWLRCGRSAAMAADSPPAKSTKGSKCAGTEGGAVRGNCQSWGPLMSHQPLSMGWLSGW